MNESKIRTIFTVILAGGLAVSLFFNMHLLKRLDSEEGIHFHSFVRELSFAQQRMKTYIEIEKPYNGYDAEYYVALTHVYSAYAFSRSQEQKAALHDLWNAMLSDRPVVEEQFSEIYKCLGNMEKKPENKEVVIDLKNIVESIRLRQMEIQSSEAMS